MHPFLAAVGHSPTTREKNLSQLVIHMTAIKNPYGLWAHTNFIKKTDCQVNKKSICLKGILIVVAEYLFKKIWACKISQNINCIVYR